MRAWHQSLPAIDLPRGPAKPASAIWERAANDGAHTFVPAIEHTVEPIVVEPEPVEIAPASSEADASMQPSLDPRPFVEALARVEARVDASVRLDASVIVDLALEIARVVLEKAVEHDADALRTLVESVLDAAAHDEGAILRVATQHTEVLSNTEPTLPSRITIVGDAALGPADAVLELQTGGWDARLTSRFERLRPALVDFVTHAAERRGGPA